MGYLGEDDPSLVDIRTRGQDAVTGGDWAAVLALEPELRTDAAFWRDVWAPACAIAAAAAGRTDARSCLDEAIGAGFSQPELHEPRLTEAFGADPDWPDLVAAMRRNVPPAARCVGHGAGVVGVGHRPLAARQRPRGLLRRGHDPGPGRRRTAVRLRRIHGGAQPGAQRGGYPVQGRGAAPGGLPHWTGQGSHGLRGVDRRAGVLGGARRPERPLLGRRPRHPAGGYPSCRSAAGPARRRPGMSVSARGSCQPGG
jgi:hypothetical protein